MFMGLPTVVSVVIVSLIADKPDNVDLQFKRGEVVSIEISGEDATEYLKLAKPKRVPQSYEKHGSLKLDAVVRNVADDSLTLQHKVLVEETGKPVRRVTLDASISLGDAERTALPAAANSVSSSPAHIRLSKSATIKMRNSLLRGDFPKGRSVF
jgi:hypothetical protein